MSLEKKIKKFRGHQVIVEMDDGKSIRGILKGDSGVADAPPDTILIVPDENSNPKSIPVNIIIDISPL